MFYPKHCWKPTSDVQRHWKDGKHQETHLYSNIKISLPKPTSSPEVFVKCRKESPVGYPLLQNHLSPSPNTSKGIWQAVHHSPALLLSALLPALCRSEREVFLKATAVKDRTKHPEFCFLPDNFYCISKFMSPNVHQPVFPLDNVSHSALSSCLDHPLTCLGCGDFSS